MAERIYTRRDSGELKPLTEKRFSTEDALQELLAEHPELLDGEQMRPGDPRRWILIKREQPIADTADAASRWSLDHLILDQDAVPTLVEVKRGANSDVRRKVVGQMLDYAAHASQTWNAEDLREAFEEEVSSRGRDPREELAGFLETDDELDPDGFWDDVETNLAAKRLRLLFVADAIPDELARVVEFLNEQMPNIEVLAVEIKRFEGESGQALVPRVIGRTAGAARSPHNVSGARRKLTRDEFLGELGSDVAREAANRLFAVAEECGADLEWKAGSASIRVRCPAWGKNPMTVAWLFLPGKVGPVPKGGREITFGTAVLSDLDPSAVALRATLEEWVDGFSNDTFAEFLPSPKGKAWAVTYEEAAENMDTLTDRLRIVLTQLKGLQKPEG